MPFMMLSALVGKVGDKIFDCLPFFLLTAKNGGKIELNLNRIIEAVLIAVITAGIIGWTMKGDIENLKSDITEVKAQVSKIYSDIYKPEIRTVPNDTQRSSH